jgi:hypothetical protein
MDFDGTLALYEEMAAEGDGQFAIAAALLRLTKSHGKMTDEFHGKFGVLAKIQESLEGLVNAADKQDRS